MTKIITVVSFGKLKCFFALTPGHPGDRLQPSRGQELLLQEDGPHDGRGRAVGQVRLGGEGARLQVRGP